ncbi:hypothetical protein BC939DRAFT_462469 [Gamsiella multidivaricata]|uniref:uncharacterized protein n=1 Tax=Gamsiella multidivaricata TaxID=101098 RepID=UPI002220E4B6|nr:uncharacterized protein BC939DRAFT_462469 [Gamsiella multidivaricata]KAI7818672.1 hypothetical protein BC939DRAFT_462469 [Gamsiella multidivaricata]
MAHVNLQTVSGLYTRGRTRKLFFHALQEEPTKDRRRRVRAYLFMYANKMEHERGGRDEGLAYFSTAFAAHSFDPSVEAQQAQSGGRCASRWGQSELWHLGVCPLPLLFDPSNIYRIHNSILLLVFNSVASVRVQRGAKVAPALTSMTTVDRGMTKQPRH